MSSPRTTQSFAKVKYNIMKKEKKLAILKAKHKRNRFIKRNSSKSLDSNLNLISNDVNGSNRSNKSIASKGSNVSQNVSNLVMNSNEDYDIPAIENDTNQLILPSRTTSKVSKSKVNPSLFRANAHLENKEWYSNKKISKREEAINKRKKLKEERNVLFESLRKSQLSNSHRNQLISTVDIRKNNNYKEDNLKSEIIEDDSLSDSDFSSNDTNDKNDENKEDNRVRDFNARSSMFSGVEISETVNVENEISSKLKKRKLKMDRERNRNLDESENSKLVDFVVTSGETSGATGETVSVNKKRKRNLVKSEKIKKSLGNNGIDSNNSLPFYKELSSKSQPLSGQVLFVNVERNIESEIEQQRKNLPIIFEEYRVVESVRDHPIVIICGETGSGKTTQVPQFLYEAGFCGLEGNSMIGVTQPRRVAAVSAANRVKAELGSIHGEYVAHQVRYDSTVDSKTKIKFMTDGILLREIQEDFLLKKYNVIIIDEAHERNLNTDVLLGLLCRISPLRLQLSKEKNKEMISPLKLVIMSATLRIEDFLKNERMFSHPPSLLKIDGRQHPVQCHFNKQTPDNYIDAAFSKVCKIHEYLPSGSILVFLSGQQEIENLVRKISAKYNNIEYEKKVYDYENNNDKVDNDDEEDSQYIFSDEEGVESDKEENENENEDSIKFMKVRVLPLYSMLDQDIQMKVFDKLNPNERLIVVATNIAETSLTIPGVRYVVDSGRVKEKHYHHSNGMSEFRINWVSQASAIQRTGRAGRLGPGHCYRLFSSTVFSNFEEHTNPEILHIPIENVVLQMKSLGISNINKFPFPSPPNPIQVTSAIRKLVNLGALEPTNEHKITNLGSQLVDFPIHPQYGKMILEGKKRGCLVYIVALVASLSVGNIFKRGSRMEKNLDENIVDGEENIEKDRKEAQSKFINGKSDVLTILNAIGAYEHSKDTLKFCKEYFLNSKAMAEIRLLRLQLSHSINIHFGKILLHTPKLQNNENNDYYEKISKALRMTPPSKKTELAICAALTSGYCENIAKLVNGRIQDDVTGPRYEVLSEKLEGSTFVSIHPESVLFGSRPPPQWIVYNELVRTSKDYIKGITIIDPSILVKYSRPLCIVTGILDSPLPSFDKKNDELKFWVSVTIGSQHWNLPNYRTSFPEELDVTLKYKWFARLLLEGKILIGMKKVKLTKKPSMITQSWTNKFTSPIVGALLKEKIDTKKSLIEAINKNNSFLLREIAPWIRSEDYANLQLIWKDIIMGS